MILEVAMLDVKAGEEADFEVAFEKAQKIISSQGGYLSHQLQRCPENPSRYILLHHFYDPFPTVEHYQKVFEHGPPDHQG